MIELKNTKNVTVTFEGLKIDPLASISLSEEQWSELYKKREVRQSVAIGYLVATKKSTNAPASEKETPAPEVNKSKKGK